MPLPACDFKGCFDSTHHSDVRRRNRDWNMLADVIAARTVLFQVAMGFLV
jgi:hypothetical protein